MPVGPFEDFASCVVEQKKKGFSDLAAKKICGEIEKRSAGRNNMTQMLVEYAVPIENSVRKNNEFLIKGTAINSTTTRNGVSYISEELSKSAVTLRNKPILKDHNNSVDSIVGRTTENVNFDSINEKVTFEARIVDESIQKKIQNGLITSVSVGAMVHELAEELTEDGESTGNVIAKGIDFVELSLVAVPADPGAGLSNAIMESFNKSKIKIENTKEKIKMTKVEELQQEVNSLKEKLETQVEEKKILSQEEVFAKFEKMLEEHSKLLVKSEAEAEPEVEAEPVAEPEEEPKEEETETQGEVGEPDETEEEFNNYEVSGLTRRASVSLKDYSKSKFNRLNPYDY